MYVLSIYAHARVPSHIWFEIQLVCQVFRLTDYADGGKSNRLGAWDALVEHVANGTIRSIGVSNYGVHHLDELESHIKSKEAQKAGSGGVLSVNQVELHPWLARPDIVDWCRRRGVVLEAYSPLVRASRFGDERLMKVVKRTGRTPSQVLVRWSLQMVSLFCFCVRMV